MLHPAHFYTAPGLAQQALLKTVSEYYEHEAKHKDCELCLQTLTYCCLKKGVKGGISQALAMSG